MCIAPPTIRRQKYTPGLMANTQNSVTASVLFQASACYLTNNRPLPSSEVRRSRVGEQEGGATTDTSRRARGTQGRAGMCRRGWTWVLGTAAEEHCRGRGRSKGRGRSGRGRLRGNARRGAGTWDTGGWLVELASAAAMAGTRFRVGGINTMARPTSTCLDREDVTLPAASRRGGSAEAALVAATITTTATGHSSALHPWQRRRRHRRSAGSDTATTISDNGNNVGVSGGWCVFPPLL